MGRRARIGLNEREQEMVRLLSEGLRDRDIAARMNEEPHTISVALSRVFDRLGAHTRAQAMYMLGQQSRDEAQAK